MQNEKLENMTPEQEADLVLEFLNSKECSEILKDVKTYLGISSIAYKEGCLPRDEFLVALENAITTLENENFHRECSGLIDVRNRIKCRY